ncbi:hypothetical protein CHISP_2789 [Chitinispirillum alkaliphilum]|nr:hypothetical protein CHISP_2789 [Chitinispirillum alkaliphilum]
MCLMMSFSESCYSQYDNALVALLGKTAMCSVLRNTAVAKKHVAEGVKWAIA